MNINKELLESPWDLIEEMADDETKEEFELDDILLDISLKIINYRISQGITQKELAKKLDISQTMVSKLESGEYNPTIGQLWKISKKLGWTFEIMLKEEIQTEIWNTNDMEFIFNSDELNNQDVVEKIAEGA